MATPKNPNTAPAAAARRAIGDQQAVRRLGEAGYLIVPPAGREQALRLLMADLDVLVWSGDAYAPAYTLAARLWPHASFGGSYDPGRDGLADLALPNDLEERLRAELDGEDGWILSRQLAEAITGRLRQYGVNRETGEWYGDWSAEQVVRALLAAHRPGVVAP